MGKKRKYRNKQELQRLIVEQQAELKKEKKLTRYLGGSCSYKKGGKGIFVGNKIF